MFNRYIHNAKYLIGCVTVCALLLSPDGRANEEINGRRAPGEDVGTLFGRFLSAGVAATGQRANPAPVQTPKRAHPLEDDWFWFDPYPAPGHAQSCGEGWAFVRIAAYSKVQTEVDMSDIQRRAMNDVFRIYNVKKPAGIPERVAQWNEARATAEPFLTQQQIARLDQIALQRMSYRAFSVPRVVETLQLSSEQRHQIRDAISSHTDRIQQFRRMPERERIPKGQESHKQVWLDVRKILTPQQIAQFNNMRGKKPGR